MSSSTPDQPGASIFINSHTSPYRGLFCLVVVYTACLIGAHAIGLEALSPGTMPEVATAHTPDALQTLIPYLYGVVLAGGFVGCLIWAFYSGMSQRSLYRMVLVLLVVSDLVMLLGSWADSRWGAAQSASPLATVAAQSNIRVFLHHLLPAILLAWSIRQALLPFALIFVVEAGLVWLAKHDAPELRPAISHSLLMLALSGIPGIVVCWVRFGGVDLAPRSKAYSDALDVLSHEISQAKLLHESQFPRPIDEGPLRLDYAYRPMNQLGGDYLHACVCQPDPDGSPAMVCTLIDVTGHGLRATLAVNQLHTLLIRRTNAGVTDPGELVTELNRYMHEHFSEHSVFATALCIRLEPESRRAVWCSAGHPPGIVIDRVNCEPVLESTTFMLGALPPEDFDPAPRELTLAEGAEIVAYSDGAIEKRLAIGKMVGVQGLCMFIARLLAREDLSCEGLMESLAPLNAGAREDDLLLVRVGFAPSGFETLPSLSRLVGPEEFNQKPAQPPASTDEGIAKT